ALDDLAETLWRASPLGDIVTAASMGIVTFRFVQERGSQHDLDQVNQRIVEEIFREGFATVSSTRLRGRNVLRLCTINPRTTEDDIRQTVYRMEHFGRLACG